MINENEFLVCELTAESNNQCIDFYLYYLLEQRNMLIFIIYRLMIPKDC